MCRSAVRLRAARAAGPFGAPETLHLGFVPVDIASGDFNGDGLSDIAVVGSHGGHGELAIVMGRRDGILGPPITLTLPTALGSPQSVAVGRFDLNSGTDDIAVAGTNGFVAGELNHRAIELFSTVPLAGASHGSLAFGYLNGDRFPDFAVASSN
jgi:hypothetical protein